MRYLELAEALRSRIATGDYGAGGELPSEAELCRDHAVSRVTVRRALEELRAEGVVTSRKGAGWFVAVDPVRQALGRFTTVEAALEAAGLPGARRVVEFGFVPAPGDVASLLGEAGDGQVLRVRRVNLAGGDPFAVVTVWVPETLGARLSRDDAEAHTFYELLAARGVVLASATQSITAAAAGEDDVALLGLRAGAPMLVCRRVTRDAGRQVVVVSEHRYPAHRTSFEVELPRVHPGSGAGPVGLHLVEESPPAATPYPSRPKRRGVHHGQR